MYKILIPTSLPQFELKATSKLPSRENIFGRCGDLWWVTPFITEDNCFIPWNVCGAAQVRDANTQITYKVGGRSWHRLHQSLARLAVCNLIIFWTCITGEASLRSRNTKFSHRKTTSAVTWRKFKRTLVKLFRVTSNNVRCEFLRCKWIFSFFQWVHFATFACHFVLRSGIPTGISSDVARYISGFTTNCNHRNCA